MERLVCVSATEVEIYGSVSEKKNHFEKTALKNMYCNWNLLTQIDTVL